MWQSARLLFSDKQSLIGNGGSVVSTNSVALLRADRIAIGNPIKVSILVTTGVVGGTSVEFELRSGSAVNASTGVLSADQRVEVSSGAIARANLGPGSHVILTLPVTPPSPQKYLEMRYVRTGNITAGAVTAAIVLDADAWYPFADAQN